jgi:hypothetical protein
LQAMNQADMEKENLRKLLVAALKHGCCWFRLDYPLCSLSFRSMLCIAFDLFQFEISNYFHEGFFPEAVMNKRELFKPEVLETLLRQDQGDPPANLFFPSDRMLFEYPPTLSHFSLQAPNHILLLLLCPCGGVTCGGFTCGGFTCGGFRF